MLFGDFLQMIAIVLKRWGKTDDFREVIPVIISFIDNGRFSMTTLLFDEIVAQALQLSPAEQTVLVARVSEVLYAQFVDSDEANLISL